MAECVQSEVDLILDFFLDIFAFIPPSTEKRQLDLSSTLLSWYFEKSKLKDDYSIQGSSSSTHSSSPSSTSSSLSLDVPSFFSSLSIPLQSPSSSSLRSESLPSILSDQHTTTTHLSHPSISHGTADVEPLIQPSHLLGRVEVDFNAQEIHERNRNRGMENTLGTTHVTLNASRSLPIPLSHVPLAALQGVRDRQALHEETPSSTHTLSTNDNLDSKLTDVYCVLLWNDDVTSFSDVYSHLKNTLRLGGTVSQRLTVLTDEVGRVVIAETKLLSHAIKLAKTLSRSRLRVTIRPKKDLHREWVAASSLTWLIRTVREEHLGLTTFQRTSLRTMVCQALLQPWQSQLMNTHSLQSFWIHQAEIYVKEIHSIFLSAIQPIRERLKPHATSYTQNRLFGMLMKDIDYWKQLRQTFKELLVSMLLVDSFYKLELARTFAEAYPYLFFHTSLDPEPDHSVLFFSVQLFTSGVVALDLVERGFYFLLLAMLNYETRRTLVKGRMGVIKGLSILCRHLTYILEIPLVQAHLVTHMYHFQIYLKFLSSIHQWYRIVRKTGDHVEREDAHWEEALNIAYEISKPMKMIAITFKSSEEALGKVVDLFKLHAVETHTFHGFSLPKMNVLTNEISVHNYLHFLLARLEPSPEYLKRLPTFLVLKIIDAPLTSLVFYAQESAGLWIRNGHFLKLSDCFYFQSKYHFLTSCLFDLDFFLVQLAFRSLPPALILPWVLDRFGFFNFDTKGLHWPYSMDVDAEKLFIDVRHKWSILESMLLLWIHSIVDATFAMSPEEKQHDILIHFLAFGSKSYVEITECLSDPTEADTASVEKKLAQVADFVSPPLSNEAGKYFLKEDVYQHINPFHKKYSRNQRTFLDEILKQKGIPLLVPKACIDPTFLIASEYVARFFTQVLLEENIPDVIVHLHFALFAILLNTPSKKFIPLGKPDQHPVIKFLEDHPSLFEAWRPHFAHEGYSMWVSNNLRQHAIHLFSKDNETLEDSNHASESFIDPSTLMDNVHKNDTKLHPSKKEIAMQRQHELMEQMKQQQLKFAEAFADEFSSDDAEEEVGLHLNNYGTERKDTHEVHTSSHSALSSKLLSPILGKSPRKEKKGMESPSSMDDSTMQLSSSSTVVIESKPSISKQETENCLVCHRSMLRTESYGFLVRFEASRFLKRQVVQDNLQFVELSNHIGFYASTCGHLVHEACLNITFSKTRLSSCPLCSRTCNAWIPAENSVFSKKFLDSIELVLQRAYEEYTSFYEDVTLFFLHSGPLSSTSPNPSQNAFYFLINTTLYTLHCVEIQLRFSQKNTSLIQLSFLRSLVCICQEIFKEMPLPLWMTSSVCFPSTLQTPPICCLDPFPKLFYNVLKTPSLWKQYLGSAYSEIHTLYPLQSDTSNLLTLIFLRKSYFLQTILFSSQLPSHLLSLDVSELAACLNIDYFSFIDNLKKIDRSKPTGSFTFSIDKLTPYSLFPLPNAYENLLLQKSQFVCPQCDLTPSSVGMCLICGQFVCLQGFCCMNPTTQKGEANTHKEVCSGEQGLFLDFSHNLIFILFLEHGRFLPHLALYLDSHGESKVREVHLGKPMYLSKTRFEQLQELWMKHDIGSLIEISQPHFTFNLFELRDRTIWHSF